jgi:hypothetical protein
MMKTAIALIFILVLLVASATARMGKKPTNCYNSTRAILNAQLANPPVKFFKICPRTTINIGIPANTQFTEFVGGDVPLAAIHDDVTIQCGERGDPADRCILSGGYIQLVTGPTTALVPGRKISTNNLRVKGLTFTGQLTDLPGLATASVNLGAPGTGMVVQNCVFRNLTAYTFISNLRNTATSPEDYPSYSSELTVQGCYFENITYSGGVIGNFRQTMNVTRSLFNRIKWRKCPSCPVNNSTLPIFLVGNVAGSMKFNRNAFGTSEIVQSALIWFNLTTNGIPSKLSYARNAKYGDLVILNATSRTDYCDAGLLIRNSSNGFGECSDLFNGRLSV